jgi:hypothetical protein
MRMAVISTARGRKVNSVREAVEKIRKVASNWLTDQTTDGATAMGEITAALLNTSFEEPQFITIDPSLTGRQLEDLRARLEDAKGQTLVACDALIDIHASEWRTDASRDVLIERRRQVEVEGRTPEHDDKYAQGDLAEAAGTYALHAYDAATLDGTPAWWPWEAKWFKLGTPRRNLVKAGALILAEIERLDRELSKGLADAAMLQAGFEPAGELPHGLTWDVAPADAIALIAGTTSTEDPERRLLVWVPELDCATTGVLAVEFDRRPAGSSQTAALDSPQSMWTVIAKRPAPSDDGWIEWNADACGPRPENVAKVRFQNGDETTSVSGVNWAPQSDSFRHCQVVAYLPKAADDGWIEWTGGLCPVADLDAMIWVRLEGDAPTTFGRPGYASRWDWRHEPEMGRTRVVAYRLTDPAVHP